MHVLFFLTLIWTGFASIHLIYLFQIKEYRFDRFISHAKELGVLRYIYNLDFKRPAVSLRNILLLSFVTGVLFIIVFFGFISSTIVILLAWLLPFAPLGGLIIVSVGILLTSMPVYLYRSWIIYKASMKMKTSKAIVIGITGSYGKTSVKEYLYHLLSAKYNVAKTDKNMNADVGIALSILNNVKDDTEYFIVEFGAYKRGEVVISAQFVPVDHAILTPLGNQHLDLYGSREALKQEETFILTQVPKDGTIYLYDEAPEIPHISAHVIKYGFDKKADISASSIKATIKGTTATIHYKNQSFTIHTLLLGKHSITNLLPAIACALDAGIDLKSIEHAVGSLQPIYGKLSLHKGPNGSIILYDGLTANIDGFIAALNVMALFPQKHKIVISQGVIELGREKRTSYKRVIDILNMYNITLLTTDVLFKEINEHSSIITFNDVSSLMKHLTLQINIDTLILIEGRFTNTVIKQLI